MQDKYQVYLISDSTGETLDRIFLALQAQFPNFKYEVNQFSFVRTNNQIDKLLSNFNKKDNFIVLYTIVDNELVKYLSKACEIKKTPCFGILGDLIISFSKLLNKEATHKPSGQHVLDEDYYKRIDAIQFTMSHDDGKKTNDLEKSDIILLGVSRTSKTPTSIYLANRGFKTANIALIPSIGIPQILIEKSNLFCVIGLLIEPSRLAEVRKNRMISFNENKPSYYTNLGSIVKEIEESKNIFKKYKWPVIDVTRKSVEEIAASIIKIFEIKKRKND